MKSGDRQLQILEAMKKNNSISVNELLEMLPASPATIRRDITALEQAGKIRKARGRIYLEDIRRAPSYEMRDAMHDEEKKRIPAQLVLGFMSILCQTHTPQDKQIILHDELFRSGREYSFRESGQGAEQLIHQYHQKQNLVHNSPR